MIQYTIRLVRLYILKGAIMKKILSLTLILMILVSNVSFVLAKDQNQNQKTVIVTLDQLDFKDSEKIINKNLAMGLLNIKTKGKNEESLFMTIATGRKVSIPDSEFKGLIRKNGEIKIKGYEEIKDSLDESYPNFSKQISFLGDLLEKNSIKTSYIGDTKKSESLIIANSNGEIDKWEERTPYDLKTLTNLSENMLKNSDVLLISFDINDDDEKIKVLQSFLKNMDKYNLIVFPKKVSGDVKYRLNNTIVPIFYGKDKTQGLLTSDSTKRDSVITSLDLFPTIANHYDLKAVTNIGNKIEVIEENDIIETNRNILLEFVNLNLIKYIFHGLVTATSLYVAFIYMKKSKDFKIPNLLLSSIILSIPISILFGILHLQRFIVAYTILLIAVSILTSIFLNKKYTQVLEKISLVTNISILIFVFTSPKLLYDSYIGYNNIGAGGRFYGFNNELMGVLIVTSIITYYFIKDRFKSKKTSNVFLIIYLTIVIISLTGNYGANFGGFLSSIALLLILLYLCLFDRKINKKTVLSLLGIGIFIFVFSMYLDMKSETGSHAGDLFERISLLGFYELTDMIVTKVKQLIHMMWIPPWSIGFLAQMYFIVCKFKSIKHKKKLIPIKFIVMFITSFIVLIINDTGVVAFVYMNTYLISNLILEER